MQVTIQTTDQTFFKDLLSQRIEGLTVRYPVRDSIDIKEVAVTTLITCILTVPAEASVEIFADWLTNRVKNTVEECTKINGQQINANTVTITNVTNHFNSNQHDNTSKDDTK